MTKPSLPRQVPYIIGNEAGERFGFYGMRNILTKFAVGWLLLKLPLPERESGAKEIFHAFVMGVYFFPLLGGWLADRLWGRYRTILWLSAVYTAGYALLAASTEWRPGFYVGLFLIALGSGGIKPCVSTFVGDQFDQHNKSLAKTVFDAFYWVINFGSFFASLLIPLVLTGGTETWRPRLAFGIPGLLMAVATLVFWLGRKQYVRIPPAPADPNSFLAISLTALRSSTGGQVTGVVALLGALAALASIPALGAVAGLCLSLVVLLLVGGIGTWRHLESARGKHPDEDIDGVRVVLRVLVVFGLVTPFWSLFDQKASTWVLQGEQMQLPGWSWLTTASQLQALNPFLVMLFIPFNQRVLFPLITKRFGIELTPLRKMSTGIALTGLSWVLISLLQVRVEALHSEGLKVPVLWQMLPYAVLTLGEVLVSATGLEFAYSQAPFRMKSAVSAFWSLAVTIGNLWVLVVNASVKNPSVTHAIESQGWSVMVSQMVFFALFAFTAAGCFAWYARRYVMVDNYRAP
jgi:proton-dependent oligopeptide transporter, POT family